MTLKVVGKVNVDSLKFKWEIDDFCVSCTNVGDCLESPKFPAACASRKAQWYLQLYPKGQKEAYKDHLSIFLRANAKIEAVSNFKIFNNEGEVVVEKSLNQCVFGKDGWGYRKFIPRDFVVNQANGILNDDKITIGCEITYKDNEMNYSVATNREVEEKDDDVLLPRHEVIEKYEALLTDSKFSDVSFVAEGRAVNVHKCILVKSSPVFAAMFDANVKVKRETNLDIDMKYDVLLEMIRFIYAGKVNNVDALAGELAVAADKYALYGLKDACEKTMARNLSSDNVVNYLQLADSLRMNKLKDKAIEFIVENACDISDKPEFNLLSHDIVCEVFRCLAKKNK